MSTVNPGQGGLPLKEVVQALQQLAPQSLAEKWDNTGLLVEPSCYNPGPFSAEEESMIQRIMLTNDLTPSVAQEAVNRQMNLVVTYHPLIFSPLKRITQSESWQAGVVAKCLQHRIAIYSPHTCLDSVYGGINDWLASAYDCEIVRPIQTCVQQTWTHCVSAPGVSAKTLRETLDGITGIRIVSQSGSPKVLCMESDLAVIVKVLSPVTKEGDPGNIQITKLEKVILPDDGVGRICHLKPTATLNMIVNQTKKHLGRNRIRIALGSGKGMDSMASTIAICAGAGASVLKNVKADVYLTGEMPHHDVLNAVHRRTTVLLCEHSSTERGFLKIFADRLKRLLNEIDSSSTDLKREYGDEEREGEVGSVSVELSELDVELIDII